MKQLGKSTDSKYYYVGESLILRIYILPKSAYFFYLMKSQVILIQQKTLLY